MMHKFLIILGVFGAIFTIVFVFIKKVIEKGSITQKYCPALSLIPANHLVISIPSPATHAHKGYTV